VIGPESTGKSTLCEELSQHFNAPWCPEFAREYLLAYGTSYTYDDLLTISKGQLALEDEYAILAEKEWQEQERKKTNAPLLVVDTNMYVMKVWCEFVFGNCRSSLNRSLHAPMISICFVIRTCLGQKMTFVNIQITTPGSGST
jgi:nicotinamide riboside kinase